MLWRIELFGGLRARQEDRVIARFASQKSGALLAYLAFYQKRSHPREELAELLWPETPPEAGRHNLRQALLSIRRQLEPSGAAEFGPGLFLAHRSEVQLSPAVTTDVGEFQELERVLREQLDEAPSEEAIALVQHLPAPAGAPTARPAPPRPVTVAPRAQPAAAPAMAGLSAPATPRLPTPVTRFFGREAE